MRTGASKRKKQDTATWTNLKDTVLSKVRTNAIGFHLHEAPGGVRFTETEGRMVVSRDWRERRGGEGGVIVNRFRASVLPGKMSSGDWLHSCVNVLDTTDPYNG